MPCDWESNGIGLPSHWPCVTDFSGLSTTRLMAYVRDEHPAYTPNGM